MHLYAYQPRGHGEPSYFIMTKDRAEADALVRAVSKGAIDCACTSYSDGLYYAVTELGENEIVTNDNG